MEAGAIRFYLDENMPNAVAEQLRKRGIEVVTIPELALRGDKDMNHLARATEMGHVICTYDADFLRLAADGFEHTGIVFGIMNQHGISDWVNLLQLIHAVLMPEEMKNHIEYL